MVAAAGISLCLSVFGHRTQSIICLGAQDSWRAEQEAAAAKEAARREHAKAVAADVKVFNLHKRMEIDERERQERCGPRPWPLFPLTTVFKLQDRPGRARTAGAVRRGGGRCGKALT